MSLPIHFFTLALDAMPWITMHYPTFRQLTVPWRWHIIEGVAAPEHCTQWCKPIRPRYSKDGTKEYLDHLSFDNRVRVYRRRLWHGKIEMINYALSCIEEKCLLWEVDADEVWTIEQILKMHELFEKNPQKQHAWFYCRYFVGKNIVTIGDNSYGNRVQCDWFRVWRFEPGMQFKTHEPPNLRNYSPPEIFTHKETEKEGLVFDHYAYATEPQVKFKEEYYGYKDAVKNWRRLQQNKQWPAKLSNFLPWVDDETLVTKI